CGNCATAIDPKPGRIAWRHALPGGGGPTGMLTTAGGLLFAGDGAGNLVAFDAATGTPLWNARLGTVTNAPQTYMLDGKQHVLVAAGGVLYAFALNWIQAAADEARRRDPRCSDRCEDPLRGRAPILVASQRRRRPPGGRDEADHRLDPSIGRQHCVRDECERAEHSV